jgi:hypothetical protein
VTEEFIIGLKIKLILISFDFERVVVDLKNGYVIQGEVVCDPRSFLNRGLSIQKPYKVIVLHSSTYHFSTPPWVIRYLAID